ncbi:MAG: energy-coupling factor transporter transmembrane protein EcfT [Anaerolineae bacterium]|nr:energy-coupling factor transporter transmembrane protein EcfT [Anaerolineae bacterium]
MLHPVSWLAWTVVVAVTATLTRNPLYLGVLLAVVAIHYLAPQAPDPGQGGAKQRGWSSLVRIAAGLALLVIPFNALSAHAGDHVIVRLPRAWPLIGGNITWEAALWGASTALGLLCLIIAFAVFNTQVDQAQVLRLTPAFLYEAGLIVSIALAFVPQMMASAREIREAQLIRGHRIRRARDMLPLIVALLTNGLERSVQVAESMESRGYGRVQPLPAARDALYKALTLLSMAGVLGSGFALTYGGRGWAGWAGMGASVALLGGVFWAQGRRVQRTRYRREHWTWRDAAALGAPLVLLVALVAIRLVDADALQYYPYTALLPSFVPWIGAAPLLLLAPVLVASGAAERGKPSP